ncbi:MAG: nucleotidyl transferase AbiEii/AbiGii toxin family protein [Gemmatimonadota bacterium]
MISDAEVRREARRARVQPSVIDLDYVLGWALWGLGSHPYLQPRLLFKGGTCLHKCYFPDYRFSEDLDFTAIEQMDWQQLEQAVHEILNRITTEIGIDFSVQAPRTEILADERDRESLQMRLYYRGPHRSAASPRAIRLDVSGSEAVVFEPVLRPVGHPYSDAVEMGEPPWPCYSLEEMMAEKVRALIGQRRYAISRDLYDIYAVSRNGVDEARIRAAMPTKLAIKGISDTDSGLERMISRKAEFVADWDRNLMSLLPSDDAPDFEEAWVRATEFVRRILTEDQ